MKSIIESRMEVSDLISASNFIQKVFNLFGAYIHKKIVVYVETPSGFILLNDIEMRDSFDFDDLIGCLRFLLTTNKAGLICTVMVKN